MQGMYLNTSPYTLRACLELFEENATPLQLRVNDDDIYLIYNSEEWDSQPKYQEGKNHFILSGWFIYKNERNDLKALAKDLLSFGSRTLNDLDAGVFVLYWFDGHTTRIITDPLGLSNHYKDDLSEKIRIAPSTMALVKKEYHKKSDLMEGVLSKKNHLFGNFTLYEGISRLDPGSILSAKDSDKYFELAESNVLPVEELGSYMGTLIDCWPEKERIVPISGGLDSRFILANSKFQYGFTYGPETSPERVVALNFSDVFKRYFAYDYAEAKESDLAKGCLTEMSYGVLKPVDGLLANYRFVRQKFSNAKVFFDGYLGDALQRGTYVNHKGLSGEFLKVFPFLYFFFKRDGEKILMRRYKQLNEQESKALKADFHQKTQHLNLDGYQKVTYYELFYGRGGRYIAFGGNTLAAQFFTVVSPFAFTKVVNTFLHQNFAKTLTYKTIKLLWRNVSKKYTSVPVESGYKPKSSILLIPFIQIIHRLMFHFIPSRANYSVKMQRERSNVLDNKVDTTEVDT